MSTRKIIFIVILVVVIIFAIVGSVFGFMFYKNGNTNNSKSSSEKFYITLEDMYCNIKDSNKILKIKTTVEIDNKHSFKDIQDKQFLIRDEINKLVRDKCEEDLKGKKGQISLQEEMIQKLVKVLDNKNITNVYFDDFIIQ